MNKPKIFIAVNNLSGGGAERVVLQLALQWPGPEQVALLVAEKRGDLLAAVPEHIEVIDIGVPLSLRNTPRFVRRLREVLAEYRPAAIISHLIAMNRMLLRARCAGAVPMPLVVVEHNNPERNAKTTGLPAALMRLETQMLYRRADHLICVSQGVLDSVRRHFRLPADQGQVIYNPVDVETIRHMAGARPAEALAEQIETARRPLYIAVGRLMPQKDFATLLTAFQRIPEDRRGTLLILGEGPLRGDLEARIFESGLAGQVLLPGFVQNPWWYMAQADLFVLSSQWEGFSLVLVEALISGTPFLSTDCPYGPDEILLAFGGGELVPVSAPDELARRMQRIPAGARDVSLPADFSCIDAAGITERYAELIGISQNNCLPEGRTG